MTPRLLLAYVPWFSRDLLGKALVPLAFCLALAGIPTFFWLGEQGPIDLRNNAEQAAFLRGAFIGVAPMCFTLGSFLFMTQSVGLDRERQHVRFYFAQPVSPVAFYLLRFLVGLGLYLLCFLPLPLLLQAVGVDAPVLASAAALLTALVLIGGLTTLCAALTQREGAAMIIIFLGAQLLQQLAAQELLPDTMQAIARGLPPIVAMTDALAAMMRGDDWPVKELVLVHGYGLGMLVAGLLMIRRAPLVR